MDPMKDVNIQPPVASIAVPSADLIVYRFNQLDRNIAKMDKKLDSLTTMFATKEELQTLKDDHAQNLGAINARLDNWNWYWRVLVTGVVSALAFTAVAWMVHR